MKSSFLQLLNLLILSNLFLSCQTPKSHWSIDIIEENKCMLTRLASPLKPHVHTLQLECLIDGTHVDYFLNTNIGKLYDEDGKQVTAYFYIQKKIYSIQGVGLKGGQRIRLKKDEVIHMFRSHPKMKYMIVNISGYKTLIPIEKKIRDIQKRLKP